MRVNEVFESIQGEGLYTGARMTFVRFQGCSVLCEWCDTKYAWDDGEYEHVPVETLALKIGSMQPIIACLTGGEPLEQNQENLGKLMIKLNSWGIDCHIETSGTRVVYNDDVIHYMDFWSISPKLSNATPKVKASPTLVQSLMFDIEGAGTNRGQLKFVIDTEDDVKEVREYLIAVSVDEVADCPWPVVLQPLATPPLAYETYMAHLVSIIDWSNIWLSEFDVRIMPQLHYLLWRGRRGV